MYAVCSYQKSKQDELERTETDIGRNEKSLCCAGRKHGGPEVGEKVGHVGSVLEVDVVREVCVQRDVCKYCS